MRGVKYVLGAESLTQTDCSGLVYRCFIDSGHGDLIHNQRRLAAGYARYFAGLADTAPPAGSGFSHNINDAEPGDLIVYTHGSPHVSHIGIYVGNGRVISALTTTGVTETHYNSISVTFAGVCLVPYESARSGNDDPGDDGDEDPADPTDTDFNNQPSNVPEIDGNIGYTPNVSGEMLLPIRRVEITFPTPTDAMFKLTLGETFDQQFLGIDTDGEDPEPEPPDEDWYTEDIPVDVYSPGFGETPDDATAISEDITQDITTAINVNEDGQEVGGGGVYASVGIKDGFVANIDWPHSICGGVGPGAYNKYEYREQWTRIIDANPLAEFPIGILRGHIVRYGIDYEVLLGTHDITGYVPSLRVGVAYGTPTAGRYGTAQYVGTITVSDPQPPEPMLDDVRTVNLGSVVIPSQMFDTAEDMWIVITPGWESQRDGYYCDPLYTQGPFHPCAGRGPRCTGEGNSGVVALTAFNIITRPVYTGLNNLTTGASWFGPAPDSQSTLYRTQYPYVTGTLTVQWQGVLADAHEYDPPNGLFILPMDLTDQAGFITVTYRRADIATTNPTLPQVPPGEPGAPYIPPPGNPNGHPYRPANQRQFGWGTIYDSTNCNMACAAMALDRHTLGQYTRYRGFPQNTPPNMRAYSGSTNLNGTGHDETNRAWDNGWNEDWSYGGPVAWSTMVANIASGRGCTVFGRYAYMEVGYKKSRTYDGPHAIYINEQLSDGSFWGYDPIVGYPIVYPYNVLKNYAESYYGFNGRVPAGFTRVTPNI